MCQLWLVNDRTIRFGSVRPNFGHFERFGGSAEPRPPNRTNRTIEKLMIYPYFKQLWDNSP